MTSVAEDTALDIATVRDAINQRPGMRFTELRALLADDLSATMLRVALRDLKQSGQAVQDIRTGAWSAGGLA